MPARQLRQFANSEHVRRANSSACCHRQRRESLELFVFQTPTEESPDDQFSVVARQIR